MRVWGLVGKIVLWMLRLAIWMLGLTPELIGQEGDQSDIDE